MKGSIRWLSLIGVSCLALSGCSWWAGVLPSNSESKAEDNQAEASPATSAASPPAEPVATEAAAQLPPAATPTPQQNYFQEGVSRAESAVAIGQSAQSTDDWNLAVSRWRQAVSLMQQVPNTDPNYSVAQQKVKEYQQNATQAEKRAAGEVPAATAAADPNRPPGLVARIPVLNQMGGTPVVPVALTGTNGTRNFTMLFDTGASGTLITQEMADAIGVVVVGDARVTVADGRQVTIPVGYVDTLKVGELVVHDILVGIGGSVGLLGQDVYGQYGLSIGGSTIDLYE